MMRWLLIRGLLGLLIGLGPSIGGAAQTVGTSSTQIQFYTVTFSGQTNAYDGATNSAGRRCVRNEGCQSRAQSLCRSVATGTSNGPFAPNRGPSESLLSVARVPDLNGTLIRVAGA